MKKHILFAFVLLLTLPLGAQTWEQVKGNGKYLYGEGWGNTIDEADQQAIGALVGKIAIHVNKNTKANDRFVQHNDKVDETSQFESTVSTYAQATLTNTEREILSNEPDAHVARWILRSEIQKIFASRISKIKDLVGMALKAEQKGKVDDALRQFYWALTLLKSVQYPNEVDYTDELGQSRLLINWIPEQMNNIFDQLSARVTGKKGDDVEIYITYKGRPVNSVDYTYFDGHSWSNIYSAKDGRGVLELMPGHTAAQLQLKYEFEYRGQARMDREIESVLAVVRSTPMRDAYTNVSLSDKPAPAPTAAQARQSFTTNAAAIIKAPTAIAASADYQAVLEKVSAAIQRKDDAALQPLFTSNGWDVYTKLIRYGKARIVGTPSYSFYQNGNYVMGRGLQMAFSFAKGIRKSFVEDVVFTFDADKKIHNISFGLGNTAVDDILNNGVWNETARAAVMNFLENYKTAYALQRLDYIESIFDDNAVIVIGNMAMVQRMERNKDGGLNIKYEKILKKNRYTKDQYLRNLQQCFAANEFINIRFANNDVRKMNSGGELYAIQIAQDYYSTNYADRCYLFLMVDINNPDKPIIKVRTWQPDKDPNFGLYGPGDF